MYDPWELEQTLYTHFKLAIERLAIGDHYRLCDVTYIPSIAAYRFSIYPEPVYQLQEDDTYILDTPSFVSIVPKRLIEETLTPGGDFAELIRNVTAGIVMVAESQ